MGSGGVGKTTVAAGIAALAARRGARTLVITVDPARRLADAMGVTIGNDPGQVSGSPRLDAAMLDAAAAWEGIVRAHADAPTTKRLVSNPYFRAIADRFPSGQAYAAGEEVLRHAQSGRYDHVVVDTPPVDGGMAFLSAPERIRTLVAGRALRVLTGPRLPGRRFIYSMTARPALKIADSVLGGRLLEDVAEFLLDLSAIYPGVVRQSREVETLFAGAAIVAVATPDPGPIAEVRRVITERIGVTPHPGTVVFNRVLPQTWMHAKSGASGPLASNLQRWATEASRHDALRRAFASNTGVSPLVIPWLVEAPSTPEGLADLIASIGFVS